MKKEVFCFLTILSSFLIFSSCEDKSKEIEDPTEDPIESPSDNQEKKIIDLSEDELANCYIVQQPGIYKFKADNQFNLGEGLPVPPQISPVTADLVWQTGKGIITSVELIEEDSPYVVFEVSKAGGNALIAVLNDKKEIEWSWHIWMPEEPIEGIEIWNGYEVMNMNLGALTNNPGDPSSYGLLYQWGRKDPFPAAATLTGDIYTKGAEIYNIKGAKVEIANSDTDNDINNNLAYSISHPTVCLSNNSHYSTTRDWLCPDNSDDALWGNPYGDKKDDRNDPINLGRKTCYDPSPAGWRVPPINVFRDFTVSGGYESTFEAFNVEDLNRDGVIDLADYNYGWHFMVNDDISMYFPAAARFDGSYAMLMGSVSGIWGNYWSNSPSSNMTGGAVAVLAFQVKDQYGREMVSISPSASSSKADAFSVRCIKE
ncbi:MAG: hypothetical protein J1F38_08485 [Muribaculaceae bacterium]|nr:hypothetical protein [Muribaculaceae bacterium]